MAAENGLFTLAVRIQGIADEIKQLEKLGTAADKVAAKMRNLGTKGQADASRIAFVKDFEKAFKSLNKTVGQLEGVFKRQEEAIGKITSKYRETIDAARNLGNAAGKSANQAKQSMKQTNLEVKNFSDLMQTAIGKIIRYRIAFGAWAQVVNSIRAAGQVTLELNQIVADLQKVMNPVTTDFEFLANSAFTLGRRFGTSVLDVAESMKVWAQQGNDMVAVARLTEATLLGVNAANLSSTESVEALTSATKAYNIEAENATEIVDKWLAVQARHAVSSQDLANATKTVAAAARVAGVDIDQLNGVVAAIGSVTRKTGREVANSFKTMLARLNRTVTAETFQEVGVFVRKSADELRPVPAILEDLRSVWGTLTKEQQANIAITVGGIRRYTDFIVLMENFDEFLEATSDSFNALGEAQLANQAQVESLGSRIQRLQTAFEELGNAFGEVVIGDALDSFAKSVERLSDAVRNASPFVIGLLKGMLSLGSVVAGVYASFIVFRGAAVLAVKGFVALTGAIGTATTRMTTFGIETLAASRALVGLSAAQKGFAVGVGVIGGLAVAVSALALAFSAFSDSADDTTKSFNEFNDKAKAEVGNLKRITDEYDGNRKAIIKLIQEKARLTKEFENAPDVVNAEAAANAKLLELYPDLVKQFPELRSSLSEFVDGYDLSFTKLALIRQRNEEAFNEANRIEKEGLRDLLAEYETTYTGIKETIAQTIDIRDEFLKSDPKEIDLINIQSITRGNVTSERRSFTKFAEDLRSEMLSSIENVRLEDDVKESITKKIDTAFQGLQTGSISVIEFKNVISAALNEITKASEVFGVKLGSDIEKVKNQLADANIRAGLTADGFAKVTDRASGLAEQLEKIQRQTQLFNRDNNALGNALIRSGEAFNEASRRADFHKNTLQELFRLRQEQELQIAAQQERVRQAELQDQTKDALDTEKERLSTLIRERDAVSKGYEAYRRQTKASQEANNAEIDRLTKLYLANQGNEEVQKSIAAAHAEVIKTAKQELDLAEERYRATLLSGGAFAKITAEQVKQEALLKKAIDDEIEFARQVFFAREGYREIERGFQNQIELANMRQVSQEEILDLELKEIDAKIRNLRNSGALIESADGRKKIEAEVLKLYEQQGVIQNKINNLPARNNVLQQQSALTLELQKSQAVSQVMTRQLEVQGSSQYRLLQFQKERALVESQLEETLRSQFDLGTADELVLKRREALSQRLLEIEKNILLERFKSVEEYKQSLDQLSTQISSTISGGIGGFVDRQVTNYERLSQLQQEIADAERERNIAIKEQNEEGLYDANRRLQELKEEQKELNSITYQWGQTFADVAQQIASIANQKLAEQFVDSLFSVRLSNEADTLGQLISSGIIIKPALADFEVTAQSVGIVLSDALRQGGDYAASVIKTNIVSALQSSGTAPANVFDASGNLRVRSPNSVLEDASSLNFVPSIAEGGEKAGDELKQALVDGADYNASALSVAFKAGVALLAQQVGTLIGGGGRGATIGSSFGGIVGAAFKSLGSFGGPLGSLVGGLIGGLFDGGSKVDNKPIFDATKSNPLPVSIEKFGEQETILHDVSINVEANFLDAAQLDPIAIRNLALRVKNETEQLLRRENLWGNG